MPLNPALPGEKRQEIVKDLTAKLKYEALLIQMSKDLELPRKLKLSSDEEAAREVSKRLFVKLGEVATPVIVRMEVVSAGKPLCTPSHAPWGTRLSCSSTIPTARSRTSD